MSDVRKRNEETVSNKTETRVRTHCHRAWQTGPQVVQHDVPLNLTPNPFNPPPPFGYIIRVDKWKSFFASQTKFKSKKCKNRFDEQTNCWNVKTTSSQHSFKNISKHFYCAQDSENLSYSFLFACNLNIILLTATCVVSVKNAVIMSFKSKILFACAPCVH